MYNNREPAVVNASLPLKEIIASACKRIPPLWSLKNFVAVNPFVGLSDRSFVETAALIPKVAHGEMLMTAEFYLAQFALGRIQEKDFQIAVALAKKTLPPEWSRQICFASLDELKNSLTTSKPANADARVLTFADFLDAKNHSDWAAFVIEEISKWCSAYYDQGQSSWRMPWRDRSLLAAWKAAAQLDANPEMNGLKNFRAFVADLPEDHSELIDHALGQLGVADAAQPDFLHRQLVSVAGWSSYVQYLVREKSMAGQADDALAQFLAIRLAYDVALLNHSSGEPQLLAAWKEYVSKPENRIGDASDLIARFIAQSALECGYQNVLMAKIKSNAAVPAAKPGQKSLQAIFCIDVRSEVFRRSLEAQSDEIETIGFAGFFGMTIEYLRFGQAEGGARCPVLLSPKIKIRESLRRTANDAEGKLLRDLNFKRTVGGAWNSFKTSAISCFSFVETAGLWFGVRLAKDSLGLAAPEAAFAIGDARGKFIPQIERKSAARANTDTIWKPASFSPTRLRWPSAR